MLSGLTHNPVRHLQTPTGRCGQTSGWGCPAEFKRNKNVLATRVAGVKGSCSFNHTCRGLTIMLLPDPAGLGPGTRPGLGSVLRRSPSLWSVPDTCVPSSPSGPPSAPTAPSRGPPSRPPVEGGPEAGSLCFRSVAAAPSVPSGLEVTSL